MLLPEGVKIYNYTYSFRLELGGELKQLNIAYHTYGTLNEAKDNVVWVFHALTANSNAIDWWAGVIGGEQAIIDPKKHFIVCANVLGSFYGTTNPRSTILGSKEVYGMDFPRYTTRDVVKAHTLLQQHLGIEKIMLAIGGSFGGHQTLEYAIGYPSVIQKMILLVTSARETPWSIAIHEAQRMAIETDSSWQQKDQEAGAQGLQTARAIGLISYRTIDAYIQTQKDTVDKIDDFKASSYVRYQGKKLKNRFHAHNYWYLTKCLDSHNVGRDRGGCEKALASIQIPTTIIGIDTDMLIPTSEQQYLAAHIPTANYYEITSKFGHDGFLIEKDQINSIIKKALSE
jgi:homoserine O-acetyltransferase